MILLEKCEKLFIKLQMLPNKNFVDEQKNISSIATGRTTNNSPFEIVGSEKIIDFLKKKISP